MKNSAILFTIILQLDVFCNAFPLSTNGSFIIDDATGQRVKLACINWASHLEPLIAEGLEKKPVSYIAGQIAAVGFNCVRFTWATFMFTRSDYSEITAAQSLDRMGLTDAKAGLMKNNPQFLDMNVREVHKAVVNELGKNNIMVVVDNHISLPEWCCSKDDGNGFFGDKYFDPNEWLLGLTSVAEFYKDNPAVVGISLRNELRGDSSSVDGWLTHMPQGANAVHQTNPNVLAIVSGLNFASDLSFLQSEENLGRFNNVFGKLVFEAHWYSFFEGKSDTWLTQPTMTCVKHVEDAKNSYLFLTTRPAPFPLFLSEFGKDETSQNEIDNRYINCVLAALAEFDLNWALWALQGSYMLREGTVNHDEAYGIMDFNWDHPKNPSFISRLQYATQINQAPTSNEYYFKLYHPQSGFCIQIADNKTMLSDCRNATHWGRYEDGRPLVKPVGSPLCLWLVGADLPYSLSSNCSLVWTILSGLQMVTHDDNQDLFCMERNPNDNTVVAKKCLCRDDSLIDVDPCSDNPQIQWFKYVPANV